MPDPETSVSLLPIFENRAKRRDSRMTLYRHTAEQICKTYERMAGWRYRPAAPSDGWGNVTVAEKDLDLTAESLAYARRWAAAEDDLRYSIGCPSFHDRPALILTVEAARLICGSADSDHGRAIAARLLRAAADEMDPSA